MAKKIIESSVAFLFFILAILALTTFVLADPNGVNNPTRVNASTLQGDVATSTPAIAGNVTELTLYGRTVTQTWQGFTGNVSGVIRLGDSAGNVMYNWTLANPRGEVYASTNSSITWSGISCFNFSRSSGANRTLVETQYNINASATDGVDETFVANSHRAFYTGAVSFSANQCNSTSTFNSTGGSGNQFQEVLLYEPGTSSTVFATLLEQDADGFDSKTHDFQMMVLEDGHNGNVASTPYYFFVELE